MSDLRQDFPSSIESVPEVVAASWRTILEVAEVHDDDDFFELGGNSLMVTRIVSYLRRELGVEVDMLQIWDTTTFADFRAAVEDLVRSTGGAR